MRAAIVGLLILTGHAFAQETTGSISPGPETRGGFQVDTYGRVRVWRPIPSPPTPVVVAPPPPANFVINQAPPSPQSDLGLYDGVPFIAPSVRPRLHFKRPQLLHHPRPHVARPLPAPVGTPHFRR